MDNIAILDNDIIFAKSFVSEKVLSNLKNDTNYVIVEDKYDSKIKRLLCLDELYCIYAQGNYILIRIKNSEFKK